MDKIRYVCDKSKLYLITSNETGGGLGDTVTVVKYNMSI